MDAFDARRYGEDWADVYDEVHEGAVDTRATVDGLASLVGEPAAILEYGAGTGRLAIPLAERGHEVVAVEISEPMLAQLRAKPGADRVTAVLGDMTDVALDRTFDLVFVAFNSIFALGSQDDQVRLFANAATHLRPGGRFALETVVSREPKPRIVQLGGTRVAMTTGELDPVTGRYSGTWVLVGADGISVRPITGRHVGHAEMDLMARLAGLELEHRWTDWSRAPFTAGSHGIVTVYRKP
ncbi:class I SAM-dependent methyltransferase [Pseudonocardia sp. CA-107938]|uniref:class I SAM-dependent methyltransferase n=1 Tax=Pseudonocardia sp. CA-107938 TaxID=3240021 RepID=UPI003D94AA3D